MGTKGHEVKHTDSGRTVFGGGGITPDHIVRAERASALLSRLVRENVLFDFAIRQVAGKPATQEDPQVTDAVVNALREFAETRKIPFTDDEFKADRKIITLRLRAQIARLRHGAEEESRVLAEGDVQIQTALSLFEEAARLQKAGELGRDRGRGQDSTASGPAL